MFLSAKVAPILEVEGVSPHTSLDEVLQSADDADSLACGPHPPVFGRLIGVRVVRKPEFDPHTGIVV